MSAKKIVKKLEKKGFRVTQKFEDIVLMEKRTRDGYTLDAEVKDGSVNGMPVKEFLQHM